MLKNYKILVKIQIISVEMKRQITSVLLNKNPIIVFEKFFDILMEETLFCSQRSLIIAF